MTRINFAIPDTSNNDLTKRYGKFKGADFSTDPSQVDDSRSPWPRNLISDAGGYPEKRPGWRALKTLSGAINGLYRIETGDGIHLIAHAGSTIIRWDTETPTVLYTDVASGRSVGFVMGERLYILTGEQYLVYGEFPDGEETSWQVKRVTDIAYIPTTYISRDPAGGGTQYESVNLLSKWRRNDFLADGTSKDYQLDGAPIDDDALTVEVNGTTMTTGFTVDRETGVVTFSTAPAKPEDAGGVSGADNVFITFARTVEGYASRIENCTVCTTFGKATPNFVFFTGNPDYPNQDWHSGLSDPTYVPDLSYALIGSEENAVMGYLHISDYLAVVKEDNQQDATIFIRSVVISDDAETTFPVAQGVQSVGAVSKYCFASLRDDPLFLSGQGVHAVTTVTVTLERTVKRRSGFVDAKLKAEADLSEAVACVWNSWYVLAVNGHCYVADSKQQSYKGSLADNYGYEWYYWDNIPARVLFEHDDALFFGTADGRICRFNTDITNMTRYSDDGAAITAEWATKADDDGDFMRYKTMTRRGSGVMIKPYTSSSVKVLIRTDSDFGVQIRQSNMSIFDFSDLDFANFSFNTFDTPQVVPFNKKIRKYKTMQIVTRNDGLNQGFGVYGIIKRYRVGNYVK